MTKYIQRKDGTFAGSIGDGKTQVPTAAALVTSSRATLEEFIAAEPGVTDAWARFQAAKDAAAVQAAAEAAEEAAWQAEVAAYEADPTLLPTLPDGYGSPAIDAISRQAEGAAWARVYDGAAYTETGDGLLTFAVASHSGAGPLNDDIYRADAHHHTGPDGTEWFTATTSVGIAPARGGIVQRFATREEANMWVRAAGAVIEDDFRALKNKYDHVPADQLAAVHAETAATIRHLTEVGAYTETQDRGSRIDDANHFALAGTGRTVTVTHMKNTHRYHVAFVRDERVGGSIVYEKRFLKMADARLFAQEMLLAATH